MKEVCFRCGKPASTKTAIGENKWGDVFVYVCDESPNCPFLIDGSEFLSPLKVPNHAAKRGQREQPNENP